MSSQHMDKKIHHLRPLHMKLNEEFMETAVRLSTQTSTNTEDKFTPFTGCQKGYLKQLIKLHSNNAKVQCHTDFLTTPLRIQPESLKYPTSTHNTTMHKASNSPRSKDQATLIAKQENRMCSRKDFDLQDMIGKVENYQNYIMNAHAAANLRMKLLDLWERVQRSTPSTETGPVGHLIKEKEVHLYI